MTFDRDSDQFRAYAAAVAILALGVPAVLGLSYLVFVPAFLPSDGLSIAVIPLSLVFALLCLSVALAVFVPDIAEAWNAHNYRNAVKLSLFLALAPALGAAAGISLLGGPLQYLMHVASTQEPTSKTAAVYETSFGSRFCRNRITLADDRAIFRQRLCRQPASLIGVLHKGGSVRLTGSESPHGFLVLEASYRNDG